MNKSITKSQYDQLVDYVDRAKILNREIDDIFWIVNDIIKDEDFSGDLIYNTDYLDFDEFVDIHGIEVGE